MANPNTEAVELYLNGLKQKDFDFDTTFGVIPVFDCFRVSDGLLKEIRPYYDPRPITEATK